MPAGDPKPSPCEGPGATRTFVPLGLWCTCTRTTAPLSTRLHTSRDRRLGACARPGRGRFAGNVSTAVPRANFEVSPAHATDATARRPPHRPGGRRRLRLVHAGLDVCPGP